MNIKNRKDLFLIFASIIVLCVMLPRSLPAIRDDALYAARSWNSPSGMWMMPELPELPETGADRDSDEVVFPELPAVTEAAEPAAGTDITSAPAEEPAASSAAAETTASSAAATEPAAVSETASTSEYTEPAYNVPVFVHSDKSYFDNALFIGDSRTVDLGEFGGLDNADFYARVGMSVFNLDDKEVNVKGYGKVTLDTLLSARGYGKVYIMLGYNEIGYNFKTLIKKYKELIDRVRTAEPTAIIYLEANLLVSEEYSRRDNDADNPSLIELNRRISELADNETIFYIDVNPVFCENGALRPELSGDGTHPYAKYYKTWAEWLCDNTVDMSSIRRPDSESDMP